MWKSTENKVIIKIIIIIIFSIFLSLVGVLMSRLISYINIHHLFAEHIISYRFLSSNLQAGVFVFGGEIWHFHIQRWWNMEEAPKLIFTTQDRWSVPLKCVLDILQREEAFTVKEYNHTHTYPPRSSNQSASTRRAQLSVAAKAVRPTDLLNHVKTWVNID